MPLETDDLMPPASKGCNAPVSVQDRPAKNVNAGTKSVNTFGSLNNCSAEPQRFKRRAGA